MSYPSLCVFGIMLLIGNQLVAWVGLFGMSNSISLSEVE